MLSTKQYGELLIICFSVNGKHVLTIQKNSALEVANVLPSCPVLSFQILFFPPVACQGLFSNLIISKIC